MYIESCDSLEKHGLVAFRDPAADDSPQVARIFEAGLTVDMVGIVLATDSEVADTLAIFGFPAIASRRRRMLMGL